MWSEWQLPDLKYYFGICLERPWKRMSPDSSCSRFKLGSYWIWSKALLIESTCSIIGDRYFTELQMLSDHGWINIKLGKIYESAVSNYILAEIVKFKTRSDTNKIWSHHLSIWLWQLHTINTWHIYVINDYLQKYIWKYLIIWAFMWKFYFYAVYHMTSIKK